MALESNANSKQRASQQQASQETLTASASDTDGALTAVSASSTGVGVNAPDHTIIVVCRRGNDSQHTVQTLREHGINFAVDLIGGLSAWSQEADPSFPDY